MDEKVEARNQYPGLFVVFDGPDRSGKGTQSKILQDYIQKRSKYIDVLLTHEPWKSYEIKSKLEKDKDAYSDGVLLADLYVDDRARHTRELIRPFLKTGGVVLCDRYKLSTLAYQWTQGVKLHSLLDLHDNRGILNPDITFLMDIDADISVNRARNAGVPLEKFEKNASFVSRVIEAYRSLGHMANVDESLFGKVFVVDGRKDPSEVALQVQTLFEPIFNNWLNNLSHVNKRIYS